MPATSSGRVRAKTGAAFNSTPSGVSSTTRRVPGSQCFRCRIVLGRMTCLLVDTVVVSVSTAAMRGSTADGKTEVRSRPHQYASSTSRVDIRNAGDRDQIGGGRMAEAIRKSGVRRVALSEIKDDLPRFLR